MYPFLLYALTSLSPPTQIPSPAPPYAPSPSRPHAVCPSSLPATYLSSWVSVNHCDLVNQASLRKVVAASWWREEKQPSTAIHRVMHHKANQYLSFFLSFRTTAWVAWSRRGRRLQTLYAIEIKRRRGEQLSVFLTSDSSLLP